MNKKRKTAIEPIRADNYPEWYQQVIRAADLAELSPVRGCMVIKPWGYALWENIKDILDQKFKETGHKNAYFPLFIPLSYFQKEATHVEGFATECAVVTHHRLEKDADGQLQPAGELEEPLIVRPTSEMIVGEMFSKWIKSYRDLPILLNQWSNVVRWEMRTRLFLRTTEILWQEGHTAHATEDEARKEALLMHQIYVDTLQEDLAIPLIKGEKTEVERFPGAVSTYTFEAMMQDGKALQGGTSHFLGQNFSKAGNIQFQDENGGLTYAWTTSWGVTTRLIGALIMVHGDDDGIILPPRVASSQIVIIPVCHKEEGKETVIAYARELKEELQSIKYRDRHLRVECDERDMRGGEKLWSWIKNGIPVRIEIGPREIEENRLSVTKRNKGHREFEHQTKDELLSSIGDQLEEIQRDLYDKARAFRDAHLHTIDDKEAFYAFFNDPTKKGFVLSHWCGENEVEEQIKKDLSVTIRCIPFDMEKEKGTCPFTGKESPQRVVFAKSY